MFEAAPGAMRITVRKRRPSSSRAALTTTRVTAITGQAITAAVIPPSLFTVVAMTVGTTVIAMATIIRDRPRRAVGMAVPATVITVRPVAGRVVTISVRRVVGKAVTTKRRRVAGMVAGDHLRQVAGRLGTDRRVRPVRRIRTGLRAVTSSAVVATAVTDSRVETLQYVMDTGARLRA